MQTRSAVDDVEREPSAQSSTIGMRLFLASLTMLFIASMIGYVFIRNTPQARASAAHVELPHLFWASTVLVVIGSFTLHSALRAVQHNLLKEMRTWLWVSLVVAVAFVVVQAPALYALLGAHQKHIVGYEADPAPRFAMYGLVFCFILLHALHVLGGVAWLMHVVRGAGTGAYSADNHVAVRHAALYWHFLDIVWIVMFGTMYLVG